MKAKALSARFPFRLRLQFSLRALLLVMFLFGVGLTWYRWPWVVTRTLPSHSIFEAKQTTTYRRGWNGAALKHGLQKSGDIEEYFVDGDKVLETYTYPWGEFRKFRFRNGKLH